MDNTLGVKGNGEEVQQIHTTGDNVVRLVKCNLYYKVTMNDNLIHHDSSYESAHLVYDRLCSSLN